MTPLLTDDEMPALPHPTIGMADPTNQGRWVHYYTAEQMRARDRAVEARVREKMGEGWIACSERMPPESTRVLVAHTGLSLFLRPGTWQDGEWWKDGGMALVGVVTHWRPLPPAPEGAGEKR